MIWLAHVSIGFNRRVLISTYFSVCLGFFKSENFDIYFLKSIPRIEPRKPFLLLLSVMNRKGTRDNAGSVCIIRVCEFGNGDAMLHQPHGTTSYYIGAAY